MESIGEEELSKLLDQIRRGERGVQTDPDMMGMKIDHVKARGCKGGKCGRPAHLEKVTSRENVMRGLLGGFQGSEEFIAYEQRTTHQKGYSMLMKMRKAIEDKKQEQQRRRYEIRR